LERIFVDRKFCLARGIADVDNVQELAIYANGNPLKEDDLFNAHVLLFSGEHKVNIQFNPTETSKNKNGLKPECKNQDIEFVRRTKNESTLRARFITDT